ncbi:hypothetical protein CLV58_13724 [Spirosoma oryzae]|uniref:Uncharacterized protein n=1 Tax=Spirosoma oryzae TaxID=1469603 RepID=A0A2T0RX47_9BACT|nr:hypothetical protein [Spirosoma oryzae]PRY25623.1 hypothetical protein CLV58_13724 [Spirosoma oryzae]
MMNSSKSENNATKKIKSFHYLDTEKMYSISSQIFEGLTDYVLKSKQSSNQETERQKGREWGSGKVLADIIEESSGTTEKRFLHDYAYNLFEDALIQADRVLDITEENISETIGSINDKGFVRVTGRVLFNDIKKVIHSLNNFNEFGYAVWYVTQGKDLVKTYKETKDKANKIVDRNKRAAAISRLDGIINFKEQIEKEGLYLDPDNLANMGYLLDYGYEGQFEAQIPIVNEKNDYLFSAILKREMLQEKEDILIKKYSRETERRFTIFGIPVQTQGETAKLNSRRALDEDNVVLKQAMMNFVSALTKLEGTFTGKLPNEYVIDPIAVYIEI